MFNNHIIAKKLYSQETCQNIIDYASECEEIIGSIVNEDNTEEVDNDFRRVITYSPPNNEESVNLFQKIISPMYQCNETHFKFELIDFIEFHILKYDVGGHYKLHCDVGDTINKNINNTRKLSFSIILNSDFEGGDLEFPGLPNSYLDKGIILRMGDCIMFPSYLYHKVRPVTSGTRWALVGWMHGEQPFR
tara:strand:+ start:40 stop:612 length:573 start_codon:yes stop_codon:yes gene_type:complete